MKKTARDAHDPTKKRVMTINEFGYLYSQSRTKVYELIKSGQLKTVRIGKNQYIPTDAAEALLKAS